MTGKTGYVLVVLAAASCFFAVSLAAQIGNASLAGTVRDPSGAVLPNVNVTVHNDSTGVDKTVPTNGSGVYVFPSLIIGTYRLVVKAQGFRDETITGIALQIDQAARVDVNMKVGTVGQEVTVTTAAPLLQNENASVGTVIQSDQVVDLPLNGRQFTQLLQLSPGTLPATYDYLFKSNDPNLAGEQRNGMVAYDVNGGGGAFVTYRLDGVDNSESEFGGANIPISVDAIGEVKIQTANFSPEYSRGPSQVDVTLKSGTNKFHGSLYEFVRNDYFDGAEWEYSGPHVTPLLKRNQFGGTLGGPIKKDKLFFFFNYEGMREVLSNPQVTTVASNATRSGLFPSGVLIFDPATGLQFPNNTIPSMRFNSIALQMLGQFPTANATPVQNTNNAGLALEPSQNYAYDPERWRTINQFNIRADYTLNASNTFFARYTQSSNFLLGQGPEATNLGGINGEEQDDLGGKNVSATWMHNFGPATINELRFGVSTNPQNYQSIGPTGTTNFLQQWGLSQFMSPTAPLGLPTITIGSTTIAAGNTRPFRTSEVNWQGLDNLTLVRGHHSVRMGFDLYYGARTLEDTARARGIFRSTTGAQTRDPRFPTVATTNCPGSTVTNSCTAGDSIADFLLGDLSYFEAGQATSQLSDHFSTWAGYVWDTWRVTSKLTVNAGLRYEYTTRLSTNPPVWSLPLLSNGQFTGKVAVASSSATQLSSAVSAQALANYPSISIVTCASAGLPNNCVSPPKDEFQPRAGFAFQINSKTVFRGGGGMFYGHALGDYQQDPIDGTFPYELDLKTTTYSTRTSPPPLNLSNPDSGLVLPAPSWTTFGNYKDPGTYQWNVALERQITKDTSLNVGYIGILARHLDPVSSDANPSACCWYNVPGPVGIVLAKGQSQVTPYPALGPIQYYEFRDTSDYQALQVKITRRMSKGLTLTAWYSHSRSIGTTWGYDNLYAPLKAALFNDVPNTATISPIYNLPFGKGQRFLNHGGVVNEIFGGWQLSGIFTARSGFPFTPVLSGTNLMNNPELQQDLPNRTCNGAISNPTPQSWYDKTCFSMPVEPTTPGAQLFEGNSSAMILRGPSAFTFDTGLSKTFAIRESMGLDFRFEMFNALNHPNLGIPSTAIAPNGNSSIANITTTVTLPRILQFAMKFHF